MGPWMAASCSPSPFGQAALDTSSAVLSPLPSPAVPLSSQIAPGTQTPTFALFCHLHFTCVPACVPSPESISTRIKWLIARQLCSSTQTQLQTLNEQLQRCFLKGTLSSSCSDLKTRVILYRILTQLNSD